MSEPADRIPDRRALGAVFKDARLLVAVETLFRQALETLPSSIDGLAAGEIVVTTPSAALPNARVLTGSTGVTIDDAVANIVSIIVDVATALGYTPARNDDTFVTYSATVGLTGERVLTGSTGVAIDLATPGQAIVDVDVPVALGYTPANAAGQAFTGPVSSTAEVKAGTYVKGGVTTFAGLPALGAGDAGAHMFITDSSVTTFAANAAGGGGSFVPVYWTGIAWVVG